MEVTLLRLTRNHSFGDKVYRKGANVFVSDSYRSNGSTVDYSDVFNYAGQKIASIKGRWRDYGNKTLFEEVVE